jgi:hypothetical protein
MSDRPSTPASPLPAGGEITRVSVTYTVNTEEGRFHRLIGLKMMCEHARAGRVPDLVYDLTVICEEVLAARALPGNAVRAPFEAPPGRREACRNLLAAVCDALDCPAPADSSGEEVFLRLRSQRARLVLAALGPVLDRDAGPVQMTDAARRLRDRVAACPAEGYAHSPLSR